MRQKIMSALTRVVIQADFKSVKKKFLVTTPEEVVDSYFDKFKKLRDENRISEVGERNIDYWGKKPFESFKYFIDQLVQEKSKRQLRKSIHKESQKVKGATLVAKNEHWLVYKIDTYEASEILGSRNWCTVRNLCDWDSYTINRGMQFYYFLSLNRDKEDRWYKIAMATKEGGSSPLWPIYWDNFDKSYSNYTMPNLDRPKVEGIT